MTRRLHTASDELVHLDLLRLIASCGIVLLHFARFLSPETQRLIGPVDGLALFVDLFFVISGFVIAHVYSGRVGSVRAYGIFLQRRIARLAPLHWATFLVFFLLGVLVWTGAMRSDHPEVYDPACILPNLLAVHAWGLCGGLSFNDVSWSISAEMAMYVIAPALLFVGCRWPILLMLFSGLSVLLLSRVPEQPWLDWTWYFGFARALPSFTIGIAMYQFRGAIARVPAPRLLALMLLALFLFGVRAEWEPILLLPVVYAVVLCGIACDLAGRYLPLRLAALGQLTYSLYMLHPLVRTFGLSFVGQRILRLEGWRADLGVLAGFAATFLLAYLSYVHFEMPARLRLGRMGRAGAAVSRQAAAVS
jgi:peptidoglycan/LPS O-acetylase OafA/YrhL